jgi:GNAT superfamily N-acetyltransferase
MGGRSHPDAAIRPATLADIATVAHHRAAMFLDMGVVTPAAVGQLEAETATYLRTAIPRKEYHGWLALSPDAPDRPVAGAGVQIRRILPFPRQLPDGRCEIAEGRQAIVLNVYTEPAFRRRGWARRLMEEILRWARSAGVESLVLHAAPDGRSLYEELGFAQTNEMRFMGDLGPSSGPGHEPGE